MAERQFVPNPRELAEGDLPPWLYAAFEGNRAMVKFIMTAVVAYAQDVVESDRDLGPTDRPEFIDIWMSCARRIIARDAASE
jgi:hypothetical protein